MKNLVSLTLSNTIQLCLLIVALLGPPCTRIIADFSVRQDPDWSVNP